EAAALLAQERTSALVLAGGTDLVTQLKEGLARPDLVVSLRAIEGLDRIEASRGELRLGAMAPLAEIAAHDLIREKWAVLAEGAGAAATPQIRNAGTLGGNLCQRPRCWYFRSEDFHCRKKGGEECFALEGENKYHALFGGDECRAVHPSDTAPALVALDASATLHSPRGERRIPLERFFSLPSVDVSRENVLQPDEILAEVHVPALPPGTRSGYLKIREKASFDFALVSCAAALTIDGAVCARARIVLGGVAPIPWRCREAEAILEGGVPDETLIARAADEALRAATPLSKNRYKIPMARTAIRRALTSCSGNR
ncbi:MAG TPA: xanthine dehydrogenase family protein subunit M, partial [Candidatus Polarisedimenticolia bacterium]|nr:xanthine dehydrogenase family protein subunit M [Candidatus Polarisedimenticolia bacterium]